MKTNVIVALLSSFCVLAALGCEPGGHQLAPAASFNANVGAYGPAGIEVLPLTEFVVDDSGQYPKLKVYVDLLDAFDARIKSPGIFRFELYLYVPRSPQPKGSRAAVWQDIDLTDAQVNNRHWRDFLRAYEFVLDLDFEPGKNQSFVLQATYLYSDAKRLSADLNIKYE